MKILLINPPRSPHNKILEYAPEEAKHFIHKKLIGPPLGLLTVAAAVKDFDVTVFDMKGEYDLNPDTPPLKQLTKSLLEKYNPDIVGVTAITSEFPYAVEILQVTKQFNKDILTVIGGLHTTLCTKDCKDSAIDVVCPGQSAHVFRDLVVAIETGKPIDSVAGILINSKTAEGLFPSKSPLRLYNAAKEDFLMPDRSHLERWRETYRVPNSPGPTTYIFTSLGCPFKCTFCSIWCEFEGKYQMRDIERIIEELKLIDYNIVRFADANTIVDVNFIDKLFDRIEEEGIKKEYIMDIRADTTVAYPWLIEKLARLGLKVVICGFESFRDTELKKYNKRSQAGLIEKAIDIFHENDVKLRGNYVIPHDYTEDDFKALAEYANSHRVNYAGYTILTPMPGTPLFDELKGQIIDWDLTKYNFFNSVLQTKLPLERFYELCGSLWLIKKGLDVI